MSVSLLAEVIQIVTLLNGHRFNMLEQFCENIIHDTALVERGFCTAGHGYLASLLNAAAGRAHLWSLILASRKYSGLILATAGRGSCQ